MQLNLLVLSGRLAAPPEVRRLDTGGCLVRYLVTVASENPRRRVDVLPVHHRHDEAAPESWAVAGTPVWVVGSVQRRFWDGSEGRRSRLEIVAQQVELRDAGT